MKKLNEELFYENYNISRNLDDFEGVIQHFSPNAEGFYAKRFDVSGKTSKRLIVEKLERELESYGIELAIDAAYKDTCIEHMSTDAIAQFHVRI